MSRVIVDSVTCEKLRHAAGEVEICNEAGEVLDHFHMAAPQPPPGGWKSPFSREDIERRRKEEGGCSLDEIWKKLGVGNQSDTAGTSK